jgi:hypothetical protein
MLLAILETRFQKLWLLLVCHLTRKKRLGSLAVHFVTLAVHFMTLAVHFMTLAVFQRSREASRTFLHVRTPPAGCMALLRNH